MPKSKPNAGQLRSIGNAALYCGLKHRRQPLNLRRNLETILDQHQRQLLAIMSADSDREDGPSRPAEPVLSSSSSKDDFVPQKSQQLKAWCETSTQALRRFVELHHEHRNKPPRIKITRLAIRRQGAASQSTQVATPSATPHENESNNEEAPDPDWLVDEAASVIPCAGIVSGRTDIIRPQTFRGQLKFIENDERWVLQLTRPLFIDVWASPAQWRGSRARVHDVGNGTSLAIDGKVTLSFKMFTQDSILRPFAIDHSPQRTALRHHIEEQMLRDMGPRATVLCSGSDVEIKPQLSADYRTMLNQDLLMELSLQWDYDPSSTLESFYSRTADIINRPRTEQCQLPTPSSSDYDRAQRRVELVFIFQERTQYTQQNLTCPLCDSGYDYKQFQRLHLHLLLHHDHFQVEVEVKGNDRTTLRRIVRLSLAERRAGKANVKGDDTLKIDWVAPPRPFDLEAHLKGDSSWIGGSSRTRQATRSKRRPLRSQKSASSLTRRPPIDDNLLYRRLPPEQVPNLIPRQKKVHPVPFAADSEGRPITFFRTNSKRPFETGELIDNSDDEVDESWIRERRRQNLARLVQKDRKLTGGRARFMADWDTHVDVEEHHSVSGDALKRDSAIRFARSHVKEMADDEYRSGWEAKIARMQKWNIFDQTDVEYCINLLLQPHTTVEREASVTAGAEMAQHDPPVSNGDSHEPEPATIKLASEHDDLAELDRWADEENNDYLPYKVSSQFKSPAIRV